MLLKVKLNISNYRKLFEERITSAEKFRNIRHIQRTFEGFVPDIIIFFSTTHDCLIS